MYPQRYVAGVQVILLRALLTSPLPHTLTLHLEGPVLDEVDVWFPDVAVVVDPVEEGVSVPVVVDEPGVVPALPHDELHLVVLHSVVISRARHSGASPGWTRRARRGRAAPR